MLGIKKIYKSFFPPILDKKLRLIIKKIWGKGGYFSGPYQNWKQAELNSTGYDEKEIIKTIQKAALNQKKKNKFVRDSVELERPDHSYPLLTALLMLYLDKSRVNIIDFGGGLGSTYYNTRQLLQNKDKELFWHVVEQPKFVKIGQLEHQTTNLKFFDNINQITRHIDMVVLSSVLQYLPNYDVLIKDLIQKKYPYIFIDRLMTHEDSMCKTSLMVEHVPAYVYKASYPCRIFNYNELLRKFTDKYDVVYEFIANDGHLNVGNVNAVFKGALLKLK